MSMERAARTEGTDGWLRTGASGVDSPLGGDPSIGCMINNIFSTICSDDVAATRDFYIDLFDLEVVFRNDWYVQLQAPSEPLSQLAVVQRDHESVPLAFQRRPSGVVVSIEVDDVDSTYERAQSLGLELPLDLRSEAWGQRHFMTIDPSGTLVDVITPIPAEAEYADDYVTGAHA